MAISTFETLPTVSCGFCPSNHRHATVSAHRIPCLEPFHASNSRRGAEVSRSQSSRPPHALPPRASCFPCAGGFCKFCAEPGSSLLPCRHGGRQHVLHGRRRARRGAPPRTPPAAGDHRCAHRCQPVGTAEGARVWSQGTPTRSRQRDPRTSEHIDGDSQWGEAQTPRWC